MPIRSRSRSPDSDLSTAPRGPLTDVINLTHEIAPSATPRTMRRIRSSIQAGMNDVDELLNAKDRQIADLTNQVHTVRRPRKRRRNHRAEDVDESQVPNPATVEERTRSAGRRFALLKSVFLVDEEGVWSVEKDETFDRAKEFDSEEGCIQGQLLDILHVLPADVAQWRKEEWLSLSFMDGLDGERATISNRIRVQSLATLVADVGPFESSTSRKNKFHELIGYNAATDNSHAFYSSYKAGILYDKYDGIVDLEHIFKNDVLLLIFACLIRGPNGAKGLFEGTSKRPQAKCMEKIYNIKRITAGVIANCAVLAIWLHSPDTQLQAIGDTTHINYSARLSEYLGQIVNGLRSKTAWAEELLKYWNNIFFPDRNDSDEEPTGDRRAEREDRDEAMAIFSNARGAAGHVLTPEQAGPSTPPRPRHLSPRHSSSLSPASVQAGRRGGHAVSRSSRRGGANEVWR